MVIFWFFISGMINRTLFRVKNGIKQTRFWKIKPIKKSVFGLGILLVISTIVFLANLQEKNNVIDIGDKDYHLNLVMAILTVYGILYAFIQFAIGYADQKNNDKYWGKSTTEVLLSENIEFIIFHSRFFKVVLFYIAIFPLTNWQVFKLIAKYESFALALWEVCLTIIYVLYIFLFTKSLVIMRRFFAMQKNHELPVKWLIEIEKLEDYEELFNDSYQNKNDLFMKVLFQDTMSIEGSERKEMFIKILRGTLGSFSDKQNVKIHKQKSQKIKYGHFHLYRMFSNLYRDEKLEDLGFSFDDLLSIYRITEEVLFNEVKLVAKDDQSKIIAEIVELYSNRQNHFKECRYYGVPHIIWDQVQSNADLLALHRYMETKYAWSINIEELDNEGQSHLKLLNQSKNQYIWKLLDCSKDFLGKEGSHTSHFVFHKSNELSIKNAIYQYILELEFSENNRVQIELLMDVLDYEQKVALVFYILLYPTETDYIKKQQYVLFFRPLLDNWNDNKRISDPEVKDFVLWKIENSNIKHKITPNLIEWIFKNLETHSTDVRLIQSCIDWDYFSYAKILMFKYIFNEIHDRYPDFSNQEHATIKQQWSDWRVVFLKEMVKNSVLLKEDFFKEHIMAVSRHISKSSNPIVLFNENDFRLFYMNPLFEITEIEFLRFIEEKTYLQKGILEFLILKLDKAAYKYLITNERIVVLFKWRVKEIIYETNLDIESYVHQLALRANEVTMDSPVSQLKKDIIIRKLIDLLYE